MLDNNPESVVCWFAINTLGAISVPFNTAFKGEYLRHQLVDSGADIIIVEPHYVDRLVAIASQLAPSLTVLHRGDDLQLDPGPLRLELLRRYQTDERSPIDVAIRPGDLNALFYTAGTTGPSKGCMLSHNFVCTLARTGLEVQGRRPEEVIWTPLPMFHLNAATQTVLASALVGGRASVSPWFSVSRFWSEILRSDARVVSLLGSMVALVAQMPDNPEMEKAYGQLRVAWAAPFPAEAQQIWKQRFGVELAGCTGYGMSETGFIVSAPLTEQVPPGTSGRRNDNFDVMIVDDEDREVPVGEVGEVVVRPRAPHVLFEGYWGRPEASLATVRNLWFHTGDLGRFDERGWFTFVDRKNDYLRRRGENISSFEVEASLLQHRDVAEAAVYGVPSEIAEDDVKASVVLKSGSTLDEEALFRWATDRLPYFALPRYIEFCAQLPKNLVGRVLKQELRQRPAGEGAWDREAAGITVQSR